MGAIAADLRSVSAMLVVMVLAKLFTLWWERASFAATTGSGILAEAVMSGLRLDMRVCAGLIAANLALSLLRLWDREPAWCQCVRRWLRAAILAALIGLTPLVTAIDLAYLAEYGHRFDASLFAAKADDPGAIALTIWQEWPVVRILLITVPLGVGLAWLACLTSRPLRERTWWLADLHWSARIVITLATYLILIFLARGSLSRQDWNMLIAATGRDLAVDRLIPSPWKTFHRAWIDHRRISRQNGVDWFLPGGDVRAAARRTWGRDAADLDAATARTALGGRAPPPRHVVLVALESYGAWPLESGWRDLGLAEGIARLGGEGQLLTRFISGGDFTMKSFAAMITGVPYAMVELPELATARTPFPSSLPATFKRLGYRTRLFYAGYASWQRIAEFMHEQGFDEVVCGGALGLDPSRHNAWGMPDAEFLPAVSARLDDDTPTLTVILTVGNHSPYDADVRQAGWTMTAPPAAVAARCDGEFDAVVFGHFWLMDQVFERFARDAAKRLPGLLLAATGDHYGRRFPNARPALASRTLVPLLLWGSGLDRSFPAGQAGGHIDIAPTLIERCAPAGFAYHAFGRDLLHTAGIGIGLTAAVSGDTVVGANGQSREVDGPGDATAMRQLAADLTALGWWRAKRGAAWPAH